MTQQSNKPMRVMLMDIEATNLKADYGYVLCICWKWLGKDKVHCLSIAQSPTFKKDPTNDKWVVEQFAKAAEQADLVVYHYGSRFDWPYLQTRALYHGLPPLPRVPNVDTWKVAKFELHLGSNRLASVAAIAGAEEKTPLNGRIWVQAMAGIKSAIKYVIGHCIQDVRVLEQVYLKIRAFRPTGGSQPKVSHTGCPACGSYEIQRRGWKATVRTKMQQYRCSSCGHWFTRRG